MPPGSALAPIVKAGRVELDGAPSVIIQNQMGRSLAVYAFRSAASSRNSRSANACGLKPPSGAPLSLRAVFTLTDLFSIT
jgi:hypothetical protein